VCCLLAKTAELCCITLTATAEKNSLRSNQATVKDTGSLRLSVPANTSVPPQVMMATCSLLVMTVD
jgi:hypothetical protein